MALLWSIVGTPRYLNALSSRARDRIALIGAGVTRNQLALRRDRCRLAAPENKGGSVRVGEILMTDLKSRLLRACAATECSIHPKPKHSSIYIRCSVMSLLPNFHPFARRQQVGGCLWPRMGRWPCGLEPQFGPWGGSRTVAQLKRVNTNSVSRLGVD